MNRRELLKHAALLLGSSLSPAIVAAVTSAETLHVRYPLQKTNRHDWLKRSNELPIPGVRSFLLVVIISIFSLSVRASNSWNMPNFLLIMLEGITPQIGAVAVTLNITSWRSKGRYTNVYATQRTINDNSQSRTELTL